jgi:hypothetical protein
MQLNFYFICLLIGTDQNEVYKFGLQILARSSDINVIEIL